jgi:hypothetical protein
MCSQSQLKVFGCYSPLVEDPRCLQTGEGGGVGIVTVFFKFKTLGEFVKYFFFLRFL